MHKSGRVWLTGCGQFTLARPCQTQAAEISRPWLNP
ncbi:MAG: hypothetical protein JNJ50_21645 [Acidobacteria bacterium]|nr:hypothetical protein [Acidobacteriota bacterium]